QPEPGKRLLPDRDEAGASRQEVQQLGHREQVEEADEVVRLPLRTPPGDRDEHAERAGEEDGADRTRPGPAHDFHAGSGPGKKPRGRTSRIAKNTRWPASTPQPTEICAPTPCATPRTIPPTSVPHREPRPPMITASNAKIRRSGPL